MLSFKKQPPTLSHGLDGHAVAASSDAQVSAESVFPSDKFFSFVFLSVSVWMFVPFKAHILGLQKCNYPNSSVNFTF